MSSHKNNEENKELEEICKEVRQLVGRKEYKACDIYLREIIAKYPHYAEPQNLFGLLLENEGEHAAAMRHFRAAWALDPTYLPARYNLELYGIKSYKNKGAYEESDCPEFRDDKEIKWKENEI